MIDAVITYVDGSDKNWLEKYRSKVTKPIEETETRYRSYDCLDLQVRLIRKFMKFVDNIFIVVDSISQVEKYSFTEEDNVTIVTHEEIIPKRYLPCFNSCTIEMFFYNIKDLKENFVYFNDDFFVTSECEESDFFINGKPCLTFIEKDITLEDNDSIFDHNIVNSCEILKNKFPVKRNRYKCVKPSHFILPLKKSAYTYIWTKCFNDMDKSLTRTRHRRNYNVYLFANYEYYVRSYANKKLNSKYYTTSTEPKRIYDDIIKETLKTICINDEYIYNFNEWRTEFKKVLECLLNDVKYIETNKEESKSKYILSLNEYFDSHKYHLDEKIIVSLTSYPPRISYVKNVLESLVNQYVPFEYYHIVLVLAEEEFPNKEFDLPDDLLDYITLYSDLIEILWYNRNIRSHKKLVPTLRKYPNNPILICDDDVCRPIGWLKMFIDDHIKYPNDIITGVGKSYLYNKVWYSLSNCFSTKAGNICNFENITYNTLRPANGFGGTLYPKNTFTDKRFFDEDLFMKLTPTSDEMWQWCFNILEDKTIRQTSKIIDYSKYILSGTQDIETTLWKVNDGQKYNNILKVIRKELKDIDEKLKNIELEINPFKTNELGNYCICSIVNNDFVPGLQVMIYSLLKHNVWFDGDIVILYSDTYSSLSDENIQLLSKLYNKIKFIKVDDNKYNNIDIEKNDIPKKFISPLIKCEIFSFTHYDKVLYLDADTLIINSIYELMHANNDIIVFTHEFDKIEIPEKLNEHVYTRQIDNKLKSINNGVILVNKNAINKKITKSMLSLFSEYNRNCGWYKGCPDQDIMCKYFRESNLDIVIYPNKYNVMKRVFRYNIKKISNECIIHYIMNKPWLTQDDEYTYINNIWHKYFNELKSRNFNLVFEQYRSKILQYMKLTYNINLNLNKPLTIQDKINWIKLYDSSELKTKCSDKILVHDYCKEKLGEDLCIPIIKTYTSYKQIRYGQLPDKFVMKCNHGSGWNKIITDKSKMNGADLYYWMTTWLKKDWSNVAGFELHYKNITPKILIEKYMNDGHDDLIDYKFLCFNGKPTYCQIISDRHNSLRRLNYYDMNFNFVDICRLDFKNNPKLLDKKPANFELMKQYAEKLSEDFNFVRVDFYEIDNKVYLGELTFTPGTGGFKYKNPQDNVNMGNLLKL